MLHRFATSAILCAALLTGCQGAGTATKTASGTQLFAGLDTYHRPIHTDSPLAQRWFDQGLALAYGFNHAEAIRSFEEAARHDPESPMPWWGIAYANGMNINDRVMTEDRWRAATAAAGEALARIGNGAPAEQALVRAIGTRYSWPPPAEQVTLDRAYADAMEAVHRRYPDDPDITVLFAESLMDLQPWDYWTNTGAPKGRIDEIVAAIESVLAQDPNHPGAAHFYIHAVEASSDPDRAVAAAERLQTRIPGAGHLVHMPSHIFIRVGRYGDAADVNTRAVAADRRYFAGASEPDLYWIYYAHNLHFLAYASMMEGRYEPAIEAARDLEREIPRATLEKYGMLIEGITPTTFHVMTRFGKWEEILAEPERPAWRPVSRAVRRYARGIAYAALGRVDEAREEIAAFESAVAAVPNDWMIFNNRVDVVLPIARAMLEGEVAFREGRHEDAFAAFRRGIAVEDGLVYDEPPGWMLPVRHALGAFLMSAGRHREAEAVYRMDQQRNRDNPWSMLGLKQALEAQGRAAEATAMNAKLAKAWARTDVNASSSCLCEPQRQWIVQH